MTRSDLLLQIAYAPQILPVPLDQLLAQLVEHEGYRRFAYDDATGGPVRASIGNLTVGIGRNLAARGITRAEAEILATADLLHVANRLDDALPWWRDLKTERAAALLELGFNMGVGVEGGRRGLLGFKNMLGHLRDGHTYTAAEELLDSLYARQVPNRAKALARQIRTGQWQTSTNRPKTGEVVP